MNIIFRNAGKRYNSNWILNNINLELMQGASYAVLGSNGSGKSTFLQLIAGNITPSKGEITYLLNEKQIDADELYRYVSFASPYLDLPEEFTFADIVALHYKFKKPVTGISVNTITTLCALKEVENKQFKYFSSGMKQRARLALAIFSDTPLLLLDEPCSNLDATSIEWYKGVVDKYASNKTIVVCSNNQPDEFGFCNEKIKIEDFKQ